MRKSFRLAAVGGHAAVLLPAALLASAGADEPPARPPLALPTAYLQVQVDSLVPEVDSLGELVTYGQHLARIRIESEQTSEMSSDERQDAYGVVGRRLTYSVLDTLWSQSGVQPLPSSGTTNGNGWLYDHGTLTAIKAADVPWLSVGHDYLVMFSSVRIPPQLLAGNAPAGWSIVAPETVVAADDGVFGRGEPLSGGSPVRAQLTGLTRAQIVALVGSANPDRTAPAYAGIDPSRAKG
ncbi:MAG: hypothetical protein V9G19_02540 [Tetrasphaera sp.]